MKRFSELLMKYTESSGMKQKSIATNACISYNYLQRLLNGDRNPSKQVAYKLADALRLSPEQTGELLAAAGFAPPVALLQPRQPQGIRTLIYSPSESEMDQATRLAQELYRLSQEIPDTLQEAYTREISHLLGYARYKYILSGGMNLLDFSLSSPVLSEQTDQHNHAYLDLIAQLIGDLHAEPDINSQEEDSSQTHLAIEEMLVAIDRLAGDILSGELSAKAYQPQILTQIIDMLQVEAPWEIRRRITEALPGLFQLDIPGAEHLLEVLRLDMDETRGVDIRRRVVESLPALAATSISTLPIAIRFLRPQPGDDFYVALATVEACSDIQAWISTLKKQSDKAIHPENNGEESGSTILQQSQRELSQIQRLLLAEREGIEKEALQFSLTLHDLLCAPDTMLLSLREGIQSSEKQIQLVAAHYLERLLPIRPLDILQLYKMLLHSTARRNIRRAVAKALPALLQCLKEASLPARALARTVISDLATDTDIYIRRAVADHAAQIFSIDREFLLLLLRQMRKDTDRAIRHRLQPIALRLAQVWLIWYAETANLVDIPSSKRRNKAVSPFGE